MVTMGRLKHTTTKQFELKPEHNKIRYENASGCINIIPKNGSSIAMLHSIINRGNGKKLGVDNDLSVGGRLEHH